MDEDRLTGQDRNSGQGEGGKRDNTKPPENVRGNTLAAAWVGLALSVADIPDMPPSPALLRIKELLDPDQSKPE